MARARTDRALPSGQRRRALARAIAIARGPPRDGRRQRTSASASARSRSGQRARRRSAARSPLRASPARRARSSPSRPRRASTSSRARFPRAARERLPRRRCGSVRETARPSCRRRPHAFPRSSGRYTVRHPRRDRPGPADATQRSTPRRTGPRSRDASRRHQRRAPRRARRSLRARGPRTSRPRPRTDQ